MNEKKQFCIKLIHCGNNNIGNPDDNGQKNIFYMPMGLFPMANELKKNNFDVEIIHLDLVYSLDIEKILDVDSIDAVGFDCHWVNQSLCVMNTAELLKKKKPGLFIFLGGYSASFFSEEIVTGYPYIDAVIRGDGEMPIVRLCEVLQEQKGSGGRQDQPHYSLQGVPNLVWRTNGSRVAVNEHSYTAGAADMERLDFSAVDLLRHWEFYRELSKFWTKFTSINTASIFFVEVGRGCLNNCTFCGGNSRAQACISNRKNQVHRCVDSVANTVKKAASFGFDCFYTCFEFENSDDWYIRLFRKIKQENPGSSFAYGAWGLPSRQLVDTLSECFSEVIIEMSPETANIGIRKKNKDPRLFYTNEQLEDILEYIGSKDNVKVQLYFGYFLPFDTVDTVFETVDYVFDLYRKHRQYTELFYGNFSTDPASLLFLEPEKYQVSIGVRSFGDYLENLYDRYVLARSLSRDMTLFKPLNISEEDFADITGKIKMTEQWLLNYNRTLQIILDKLEDRKTFTRYLRGIQLNNGAGIRDIREDTKDVLIDFCSKYLETDRKVQYTIEKEYETVKQNATSLQADQFEKHSGEEAQPLDEEERKEILAVIKEDEEIINIEFDI